MRKFRVINHMDEILLEADNLPVVRTHITEKGLKEALVLEVLFAVNHDGNIINVRED